MASPSLNHAVPEPEKHDSSERTTLEKPTGDASTDATIAQAMPSQSQNTVHESEEPNCESDTFDDHDPLFCYKGMISKVLDGLYISGAQIARDKDTLKESNITHIVCLNSFVGKMFPNDFKYLEAHIEDACNAPLAYVLDDSVDFIHNAITKENGRVLVHCHAGVSRSAAVVIAYLIKTLRVPYDEAYHMLKQVRPIIQPNRGFEWQLRMYQEDVLWNDS